MSIAIQWTEPSPPCDTCRYDHVKAGLPFGEFSIEWKSWKEHDAYCVYFNGDYVDSGADLDTAKAIAAKFYCDKLAQHAELHQGELVAWLTKCKKSGLVEQAEPNEKASNPEHWTDAFPVYNSSVEYEIAGYEGSSGLYYSRLAAVANGEQSVEPVYRVKK